MKFSDPAPPIAGPSSLGIPGAHSKVLTNGNGFVTNGTNGSTNGTQKHANKEISRRDFSGTTLYPDSTVDREQFVRLVIQSLRDVGYAESAATLEAESGYSLETYQVAQFREYILDGAWSSAEDALARLAVTDEYSSSNCKFLIRQQEYLELLEAGRTTMALQVLRNDLAPLNPHPEHLHELSSLIMCSDPDDFRQRAQECIPEWDGNPETSRQRLLGTLQHYIPSSLMIPPRRFLTLLEQARATQQLRCDYHNPTTNPLAYSLYTDHRCDESIFPRVTTTILTVHDDEVWNMEWSHNGLYLASGGKGNDVIVWQIGLESDPSTRDCFPRLRLKEHPDDVGCLAWSPDDAILLTSSGDHIRIWNAKTGDCDRKLDGHTDTVTSLVWLPDGSGFLSASLDKRIILWSADGSRSSHWAELDIRITGLAITPDLSRLVIIGMAIGADTNYYLDEITPPIQDINGANTDAAKCTRHKLLIYDYPAKLVESTVHIEGELTSVKISPDSQYALLNHSPDEVQLWSIKPAKLLKKYLGHRQSTDVIRSCFGGADGGLIVSGSQDGKIYVWNRDSGFELEILAGHGDGSVNNVAWHPHNTHMFASCSDDRTIRLWEYVPQEEEDLPLHLAPIGRGRVKDSKPWE